MKKLFLFLLTASLALNLALAALRFAGRRSAAAPTIPAAIAPAAEKPAPPAIDASLWPSLQAETLPELVRKLRDAGFPPELVRAIATGRVDEIFAARMKALFPGTDALPFWKALAISPGSNPALEKLRRERQLALREALGLDAEPDDPVRQTMQGRRVDMLPPDKADALRRLFIEFEDKGHDLVATGVTNLDRDRFVALEKAQREAIARLLTPQELEEFDLRNNPTARRMRNEFAAFDVTEAEFRALFRLRQPFDEQTNNLYSSGAPTQEQRLQRNEAQKLLNEQIKATLGPERFAEFERATDVGYRTTSQLVTRLQLPLETTYQVWSVQKDIQPRATALIRDQSLAPDVRNQQLAALQTEATAKLTPLLGGARGMEAYKQFGGSWLQSLQPRPTSGAPPPRP